MEQPTKKISTYIVKILNGMAQGLFASLIIGLIIKQFGLYLNAAIVIQLGQIAQYMMGPAIGVGVALSVGAPPLAIFASAIVGAIGAGTFVFEASLLSKVIIGEPVGALLAALIGAEVGKRIAGKTKVDIILIPLIVIVTGAITGLFLSPVVAALMNAIGALINHLTTHYPIPMGIMVAVVVGMVLTLPISSAAICISLGISGLAAGAATVGCCAQMIGFACSGYKENKIGGLISQGLGTSMIQMPNIVKNWRIWVPPTLTAAILGPLATTIFQMKNNAPGAGMGTSGLVGQINTIAVMGIESWWKIGLLHFLLPAILSLLISQFMRKKEWIKDGDYVL
ncbi:MAG: PTS sugar transporter subunit IIC [Sphaerochaetaceae bacterium]|nr:PTS sugar transporter subunit IIC [Sphaerochaetaceae bacterium]